MMSGSWAGSGGGGCWSLAGPDGGADLGGVEVIVDQAVDDVGQLGLHQRDAERLQGGVDGSQGVADLLDKLEYFVNGGVARQKLVNIGDHVHTYVAQQALLQASGLTGASQEQQSNQELEHLGRFYCVSFSTGSE